VVAEVCVVAVGVAWLVAAPLEAESSARGRPMGP